jgi:hypothetical protein
VSRPLEEAAQTIPLSSVTPGGAQRELSTYGIAIHKIRSRTRHRLPGVRVVLPHADVKSRLRKHRALGGFSDKGRDAIHVSRFSGEITIFAYSVREDWNKKLNEGFLRYWSGVSTGELKCLDENGHTVMRGVRGRTTGGVTPLLMAFGEGMDSGRTFLAPRKICRWLDGIPGEMCPRRKA